MKRTFKRGRLFAALAMSLAVGNLSFVPNNAAAAEAATSDRVYYGRCVAVDDRLVDPQLRLDELAEQPGFDAAEFAIPGLGTAFIQPFVSNVLSRFGAALRRASGADGNNVKEIHATRAIEILPGESATCIQFVRGDFFDSLESLRASAGMNTGMPADIVAEMISEGLWLKGEPLLFVELALKRDASRQALTLAPTYFSYGATFKKRGKSKKPRGLVAKVQYYPVGVESDHTTAKGSFVALGSFRTGEYRRFDVLPAGSAYEPPAGYADRMLAEFERREGPQTTGAIRALLFRGEIEQMNECFGGAEAVIRLHQDTNEKGEFGRFYSRLDECIPGLSTRLRDRYKRDAKKNYLDNTCVESPLVQIDSVDDIKETKNCVYYAAFEKEGEWFQNIHQPIVEGGETAQEDEFTPQAFNLKVTMVETRNVNGFLLFLSDVFSGAQAGVETALVNKLTPETEAARLQRLSDELTARNEYDAAVKKAWDDIDSYCEAPTGSTIEDRGRRRNLAQAARAAQETANMRATKIGVLAPFTSLIPRSALEGGPVQCPRS